MSAPPLANGQAVFGGATQQAPFGGASLDASMLQQQGTPPAMTPDMAAALQVLIPTLLGKNSLLT